ncbi:hypothetical protein M2156_003362 [Streptomyces sp. SAI-149]|nr:hypothetical protein [Streptomyces sp. SAI-149]
MQHPRRVRGAQRAQQVGADPRGLGGVDRAVGGDPVGEGTAVDQLHDDVRPFVLLDDVVDHHDVRVAQPGDGTGLAQGALALEPGVLGGECLVERDLLDGDLPAEQLVGRPPHHAHATAADPRLQAITARDHTEGVPLGPHEPHHAAADEPTPGR